MTRRSGRLAIAAAVLAVVTHVACTSGGDVGGPAATSTASDSAAADRADYAVGKRRIELVDRSRPTAADPGRNRPERSDRTIPVTLLYPAEGAPEAGRRPVEDAPVADGRFSLVAFSHGWTVSGDSGAYQERLEVWVGAGYVVAAPTFPLTTWARRRARRLSQPARRCELRDRRAAGRREPAWRSALPAHR